MAIPSGVCEKRKRNNDRHGAERSRAGQFHLVRELLSIQVEQVNDNFPHPTRSVIMNILNI
jgi:hypothetical protein